MVDVWSRNNLWHLNRDDRSSYSSGHPDTRNNNIDYDLYRGSVRLVGSGNIVGSHLIKGLPEYAPGNGAISKDGGNYALKVGSSGFDAGEVLPNFNDGFTGKAPDIGAHEAGTPPLKFGVDANPKS
jgi:hypothetical protein